MIRTGDLAEALLFEFCFEINGNARRILCGFTVSARPQIKVKSCGSGGLPELRKKLKGDEVAFGGFVATAVEAGAESERRMESIKVSFTWIGSRVNVLERAFMASNRKAMDDFFSV